MILDMQSIVLPQPGPIGDGPYNKPFFTYYNASLFKNKYEWEDLFNISLIYVENANKLHKMCLSFSSDFVLIRQDISPRNLILDRNG